MTTPRLQRPWFRYGSRLFTHEYSVTPVFTSWFITNSVGEKNQAIRYLQHVVQQLNNTDPAIHNFLLTLYATQPTRDESALLQFLASEVCPISFCYYIIKNKFHIFKIYPFM